ncbi:MAG: PAS domain-containing protein, partial [Gammaproteobacteria bacterium]|nr:PAS domain-containing protein [Gammaproteobacteria bacterium]
MQLINKNPEKSLNICLQLIEVFVQKIGINFFFVIDTNGNRVYGNDNLAKIKPNTAITPECFQACKEVMKKRESLIFEEEYKGQWFLSVKSPFYDSHGNVDGVIGISIDITDKKEMEKALITAKQAAEVASAAKSEFIQNMSHDLRTALTGLLSVAEIQADNLPDHHEHKEHFVLMRDASRDLHAFCETVLETASLDHPSDLEALTPFSLETLITHKVELFKPAMLHKGLTCSVKTLSDSLPSLLGHPLLLERVVINLMGNAIKFTEVGGITIQYGLTEAPSENAMTHQLT